MMTNALQVLEPARDEAEAREMLAGLELQDGFLGGRVLPAANGDPWRVQGFMVDESETNSWLPDGVRRVIVPEGLARYLGPPLMFPPELDLGGRTYRVHKFHPSASVVGVTADPVHRRRLEARLGAGLLILEADGVIYQAKVGTDYGIDPRHITRRA